MIYISHRGNLRGPNPDRENQTVYIEEAIRAGFDVEIDLWYDNSGRGSYYLGHDAPYYEVTYKWLETYRKNLWVHCKNISTFTCMVGDNLNLFFHEREDVVLTTECFLWYHVNTHRGDGGILVLPEEHWSMETFLEGRQWGQINCDGICSDYIADYKDRMESGLEE